MAYDVGPYHFLFVDPGLTGKLFSAEENQGDGTLAAWKNYGGDKTWPAPQGWETDDQWHGPPDPVLDSGRYTVEEFNCDEQARRQSAWSARLTNAPACRLSRRFTLRPGIQPRARRSDLPQCPQPPDPLEHLGCGAIACGDHGARRRNHL